VRKFDGHGFGKRIAMARETRTVWQTDHFRENLNVLLVALRGTVERGAFCRMAGRK